MSVCLCVNWRLKSDRMCVITVKNEANLEVLDRDLAE